jgi:hypothetical protein
VDVAVNVLRDGSIDQSNFEMLALEDLIMNESGNYHTSADGEPCFRQLCWRVDKYSRRLFSLEGASTEA